MLVPVVELATEWVVLAEEKLVAKVKEVATVAHRLLVAQEVKAAMVLTLPEAMETAEVSSYKVVGPMALVVELATLVAKEDNPTLLLVEEDQATVIAIEQASAHC